MGKNETYSLWQEAYDKAMGRVHFPVVEYKPPKKRVYRDYMYCPDCHLVYSKSRVYAAKYCVQCGKTLIKRRKLIAKWVCYDNLLNGKYHLICLEMSSNQISKE